MMAVFIVFLILCSLVHMPKIYTLSYCGTCFNKAGDDLIVDLFFYFQCITSIFSHQTCHGLSTFLVSVGLL